MKHALSGALLLCAFTVAACRDSEDNADRGLKPEGLVSTAGNHRSMVADIVASEETILEITPLLRQLGLALLKPNQVDGLPIHSDGLVVKAPPEQPYPQGLDEMTGKFFPWTLASLERTATGVPLQKTMDRWTSASFGVLEGRPDGSAPDSFVMQCSFEGRGMIGDMTAAITAKQKLVWKKEEGKWILVRWEQKTLSAAALKAPLFSETLALAVDDPATLKELRRSRNEEMTVQGFQSGSLVAKNEKHGELPDLQSSYQYPCVSVVDVDGDGLDDLFVTSRLGEVQLLRNEGGGKLKDITSKSGLSLIEGFVNNATFADFDNDGDPDLFLGRSLESSVYFVNESGYFRDKTMDKLAWEDIYFVSSSSAVDINRDGLLDLYLCTYAPPGNSNPKWFERYYTTSERREIMENTVGSHRYINLAGPPNVILMNRGDGKLERVRDPSPLRAFRSSFQAVWADIDSDGDADCYLCNDFAPDLFLRNDTPVGASKPVFTDVGESICPDGIMGFGMGSSWGDYDSDGDLDLYVSNMYSKAGKRIISMSGEVDARITASANGNFLYENTEGVFKQVAGRAAGQIPIEKVGWSFGGQFADFDNDGKLDLYVPSGYYSAPKSIATEVDL